MSSESRVCVHSVCGEFRDLGADGPDKDVIVSFLGSVRVDTCI